MKMHASWLLIPAMALGLGACKKKEEAKAPDTKTPVAEAVEQVKDAVAAVTGTKIEPEERAAKLGFVRHLPMDTEVVLAFYNGTKVASRVKGSKLWKLVQQQMAGGAAIDEEDILEPGPEDEAATEDEPTGPAALFGSEFTMAMGKSTGEQVGHLLTLNRRMGYFQMRGLARAFAASVKDGEVASLDESLMSSYGPDLATELLKDPQSGIALLEKAKMPPLYFAFKTKEADLPTAAQQVAAMVANVNMLGEMVEPLSVEISGNQFLGSKILGAKISATLAEDRESMEEELGAATVDQLLAAIAKKDLVVLSGTVGDHVLLFVGASADDLKLAAGLSQSIVSTDSLAFSDEYLTKDFAMLGYGEKAAMDTLILSAGGFSEMTNGLRDGLAGAEGLGDTRDLEALFQLVAEREAALRKLAGNEALGMVGYFEDGLKIESYGGSDNGMVDWKSSNQLGHLGDSEDVVLFADLTGDAAYDEKARAYFEALFETAYALSMKVADLPLEGEEMAQFQGMAKLFDTKFRPDMAALWDAFSNDFGDSLGHESALVVDFKGGAPAVPGVPAKLLDEAKIPRISLISPVTDRAKLTASWEKMNTTLTGTLAKISEITGEDIPMQKPMSSERGGNTTWFFPMPFLTDDFVPSVTVGDKWFAASTSKNHALDLIAKAEAGGKSRDGFWFSMNFKALEKYAGETLKLVEENAEAMSGAPLEASDRKLAADAIAVLGDLDKLTVHSRRESGVLRSSVHFKTR